MIVKCESPPKEVKRHYATGTKASCSRRKHVLNVKAWLALYPYELGVWSKYKAERRLVAISPSLSVDPPPL